MKKNVNDFIAGATIPVYLLLLGLGFCLTIAGLWFIGIPVMLALILWGPGWVVAILDTVAPDVF